MTKISTPANDLPRLLESWQAEKQSAYLYERVARRESDPAKQALFRALAASAEDQSHTWADKLAAANGAAPSFVPELRVRLVAAIVDILGPRAMIPALAALKIRGVSVYTHSANSATSSAGGHPNPHAGPESSHRGLSGGGNLRAAVFGVNDGLLSNASLILGVAGAAADAKTIAMTAIAGLAAGAFSMAAGEYVSVRSQRELFERQIALERDELAEYPEEEALELAMIYEARGIPKADALALATKLIGDPEHALDTLAREELGLNPDELGSPWGAAVSSFAAFAMGGAIPLLPFLLPLSGVLSGRALMVAMALTAIALFGIGASLSLFTGRNAWFSGARMLLIGALAGGVTFSIGKLFGVALG